MWHLICISRLSPVDKTVPMLVKQDITLTNTTVGVPESAVWCIVKKPPNWWTTENQCSTRHKNTYNDKGRSHYNCHIVGLSCKSPKCIKVQFERSKMCLIRIEVMQLWLLLAKYMCLPVCRVKFDFQTCCTFPHNAFWSLVPALTHFCWAHRGMLLKSVRVHCFGLVDINTGRPCLQHTSLDSTIFNTKWHQASSSWHQALSSLLNTTATTQVIHRFLWGANQPPSRPGSGHTGSPRMQVQQSSLVLCFCSSSWVTSIRRPLSPVRSFPLLENRIQSIRLWPGFRAT